MLLPIEYIGFVLAPLSQREAIISELENLIAIGEWWKIAFAILSAILVMIGEITYLVEIFRKEVRPNPYPFLIWSIQYGMATGILFINGAGLGITVSLLETLVSITFTVIGFTKKYGYRSWSWWEAATYFLTFLAMVLWLAIPDPLISIICLVISGGLSLLPVYKKVWYDPQSESATTWFMYAAAVVASLIAITDYTPVTILGVTDVVLFDFGVGVFVVLRNKGILKGPKNPKSKDNQKEVIHITDSPIVNLADIEN